MGKFVFVNPYLSIEPSSSATPTTVFTSYVRSLTLSYSAAEVEATCFLAEGIARLKGLKDWNMDLELAQDHADNLVDELLWGMMNTTKSSLMFNFRPTTAAVGPTNPTYSGEGLPFEYVPATGSPGDLGVASISFRAVAGTSAGDTKWLKRATA